MVGRSCSIKNCRSEQYPGCPFHFRRIPSKPSKQELRQKWLQALEGKTKRDTFTKNTVVCSLHFKPSDYLDTSKRVLKDNAVPSVFPENTGGYLSTFQKLVASKRVNVNPSLLVPVIKKNAVSSILPNPDVTYPKPIKEEIKMESDPLDGIKNSPLQEYIIEEAATSPRSAFTASPFHSHNSQDYTSLLEEPSEELILVPSFREVGVQFSPTVSDVGCQTNSREKSLAVKLLQQKVKILQKRLRRREDTIKKVESVLKTLKTKEDNQKSKDDIVKSSIVCMRKDFNASKNDRSIRYSDELKQFALSLYFESPKAYEFLRDYIVLPHPASLRKY